MNATEVYTAHALRDALAEEMERDAAVVLYGEDIGRYGGVFKVTDGLQERFGAERVRDTPISEQAITGMAFGAAMMGLRPILEIEFMDFIGLALDQIVNNISHARYVYGNQFDVPLVIRMPAGAGRNGTAQHSKSLEAWLAHIPGLVVALPSTAADAKGLLKRAIRSNNPVCFIENKLLYQARGEVFGENETVPFGVADVKREGTDVTVIAISRMVTESLKAAETLARDRIGVEVVDPRTVRPLDIETLAASVRKTRRAVIVHEAWQTGGVGAEIAAQLYERCFADLEAPVRRVCGMDVPIPFSQALEPLVIPNEHTVAEAVRAIIA